MLSFYASSRQDHEAGRIVRPDVTDWDSYYKRPARFAPITRRISAAKILRALRTKLDQPGMRVCELGGGNSCFIEKFLALPNLASYHVIDQNAYGVELLTRRFPNDPRVSTTIANVLDIASPSGRYDVVYSVGLIEHFDEAETAKCIDAHFCLARPGGAVLITFPTPTLPYRVIRRSAEMLGIWAFPDERALVFDEVTSRCSRHGRLEYQSINWAIGLTQGYVMAHRSIL